MTGRSIWDHHIATMRPEQCADVAEAIDRLVIKAEEALAVHAQLAQDPEWRSQHDAKALAKLDRAIATGAKRLRKARVRLAPSEQA